MPYVSAKYLTGTKKTQGPRYTLLIAEALISPNQSSFGPNVYQKRAYVRAPSTTAFDITMQNLKLFTASCRGICALFSRFSRSGVVSHARALIGL